MRQAGATPEETVSGACRGGLVVSVKESILCLLC